MDWAYLSFFSVYVQKLLKFWAQQKKAPVYAQKQSRRSLKMFLIRRFYTKNAGCPSLGNGKRRDIQFLII